MRLTNLMEFKKEDYVERFYEINSVRFDMIKDKPVIVLSEKFENE